MFAKGARPDADALIRLSVAQPASELPFSVIDQPQGTSHWLELLIHGLSFDCRGLAPGSAMSLPACGSLLGLKVIPQGCEAIELSPAPHLVDAGAMLPVVRGQMALALRLVALPGIEALCWHPAQGWMEPGYFRRTVQAWIDGGAFPALGLTTLVPSAQGGMKTVGLGYFKGFELEFDPYLCAIPAKAAQLAVRIIHDLVSRQGPPPVNVCMPPDGLELRFSRCPDGRSWLVGPAG